VTLQRLPSVVGSFSDAVVTSGPGRLIHVAGHIALDEDGNLVPGGIVAETKRTLANIERTLGRANATLADLTRILVFLADLDDYPGFVTAREEVFGSAPPASATVQAGGLLMGARIEIEATAFCTGADQ